MLPFCFPEAELVLLFAMEKLKNLLHKLNLCGAAGLNGIFPLLLQNKPVPFILPMSRHNLGSDLKCDVAELV